jgi:hypothetical protein
MSLLGQQTVSATSGSLRELAGIRARFAAIERELPTSRVVAHAIHDFSTEGGELRAYFRGAELQKLRARYFDESGRAREEYYFANGELVFMYRVDERYDQPLSGRVNRRMEHRYYLNGGQLIRRIRTPARSGSDEFGDDFASAEELRRNATLFARCATATGANPKECYAPER